MEVVDIVHKYKRRNIQIEIGVLLVLYVSQCLSKITNNFWIEGGEGVETISIKQILINVVVDHIK